MWYHTILPANVLTAWFGKQTFSLSTDSTCTAELASFNLRVGNWLRSLSCNITWTTNFNLNKFENLSIQYEKQSIISIQSFFSVMGWKQPSNHFKALNVSSMSKFDFFCLIHKVDFCLANVNLQVSKWFAMYPVNFISHNKYTW